MRGTYMGVMLSVIVPVFNKEKEVERCIQSLVANDYSNMEIVCVDDGSSDESWNILSRWAAKDNRIQIIHQDNQGVSSARNTGIRRAKGEYIGFVDADDYVESDYAHILSDCARSSDADIVVFGGKTIPYTKWADDKLHPVPGLYEGEVVEALFNEASSKPFVFNKLFKRSLLVDKKISFNETLRLGEDQAFMFEAIPAAKKVLFIDDILYNYVQNTDSAMHYYNVDYDIKLDNHIKIVRYIVDCWKRSGYIPKHGIELAKWILTFLSYDIEKCGFNTKIRVFSFIDETIELICDKNLLDEKFSKKLNVQKEILSGIGKIDVSVIVPVYNAEAYLPESLKALSNQTFTRFEMIFVDDGSNDKSLDILYDFEKKDSRCTVLQQNHQYAGAARNLGLSVAKGNYILFLDADDFYNTKLLERAYSRIKEYKADICIFGADRYDQVTKKVEPMRWFCKTQFLEDVNTTFSKNTLPKHIFEFTTGAPWNKLYRKEFIDEHGLSFQGTRSANDTAFVMTSLALADRIIALDEILITYRVNNALSLQGSQDKDPIAFYNAMMELKSRLIKFNVYDSVKDAFINFAVDFCFYNLGTIKTPSAYEKVFNLIKDQALVSIDAVGREESFFYAYPTNRNYEKYIDIQNCGVLEFATKYKPKFLLQVKDDSKKTLYNEIPWKLLGKNVAIYGAGVCGQGCYKEISESKSHCVAIWVDKDWEKKRDSGLDVKCVEKLCDSNYDTVLIAIMNKELAEEIRQHLTTIVSDCDIVKFGNIN